MISQSLYFALREINDCHLITTVKRVIERVGGSMEELQRFVNPYVLVIHRSTRRGFYLTREYRHIINVSSCREPKNPVEVERNHLCACSNMPAWVGMDPSDDFDTFWLY